MVATARPLPPRAAARPAPVRRPTPARTPGHAHAAPSKPATTGTLGYVLIGIAVAIGAAIAVGVIWEFGAARTLSVPSIPPSGSDRSGDGATRGGAPTVMYKDMRDGRVLVFEVGPEGTRLKGSVAKSDLPLAENMNGEGSSSARRNDATATDRVNALGSAFR